MNSYFTPDGVLAICASITVIGGVLVWLLNQKDKAQQVELDRIKDDITARDKYTCLDMQRITDSLKKSWEVIDRLKEERAQFWTREEHEKWRAEMKAEVRFDVSDLGTRLIREMETHNSRFREEVAKLAANCARCKE